MADLAGGQYLRAVLSLMKVERLDPRATDTAYWMGVAYQRAGMFDQAAIELRRYLALETDSPYGPPRSHQGQRNEPAYLKEAAAAIAELRGAAFQEVASSTTENAVRLFGLVRTQEEVTSGVGPPGAERGAP